MIANAGKPKNTHIGSDELNTPKEKTADQLRMDKIEKHIKWLLYAIIIIVVLLIMMYL
jgi:hypothetical protein